MSIITPESTSPQPDQSANGEVINRTHYFGACPECGGTHGYLNIGRTHVGVCDTHKTKWAFGANLFSPDESDTAATWAANADRLRTYREVEPLPMAQVAAGEAS